MLILTGLLLITVLLAGVSYAVFNSYASQNSTNTLAATCIELEFSGEDSVNLTNAYPISTSEGLKTTPYKFKIKNKCKNYLEYIVIASVINVTNPLDSKYVKVNLSGDNEMNSVALSSLKSIQTPASLSGYSIKENYVLKENDGILKDEERNFEFRMWLDGENEEVWTSEQVESKNYQVKISVIGTVKTEPKDDLYIAALIDGEESLTFPTTGDYDTYLTCTRNGKKVKANESIEWTGSEWALTTTITDGNTRCNVEFTYKNSWDNPRDGTLLAAIKRDNTVTVPLTTPGLEVSMDSESVLSNAEDDYGTSYYFRGAVENNYVEYANMCWRIVRVTGNGAIKLVLYNSNGLTETNTKPGSESPCNYKNETISYQGVYNDGSGDNTYIGLMYGEKGRCSLSGTHKNLCTGTWNASTSYTEAHTNINKSTALEELEKWYNYVLLKNNVSIGQLADTIWCNDKSVVTDTTFNPGSLTLGTSYGFGENVNYYGTVRRLVQASSWGAGGTGPSLICPNDNNGGKLSKFTVSDTTYGNSALTYKIGMLTADEVAYAGITIDYATAHTYLNEDDENISWLLLSPAILDNIFYFDTDSEEHAIQYAPITQEWFNIRPSISLISSIKISSGDGTATNPYKIAV